MSKLSWEEVLFGLLFLLVFFTIVIMFVKIDNVIGAKKDVQCIKSLLKLDLQLTKEVCSPEYIPRHRKNLIRHCEKLPVCV